MRKQFITTLIGVVLCLAELQAQTYIGVDAGIPVGDLSDRYTVTVGVNIYYLFEHSSNDDLKFGGASGFIYYADKFGGGGEFKDASFIPIAGAMRIKLFDLISFGPDIGYAVVLEDLEILEDKSGGFYWKLAAGINIFKNIEINAFYHNISAGATFSTIGLGGLLTF